MVKVRLARYSSRHGIAAGLTLIIDWVEGIGPVFSPSLHRCRHHYLFHCDAIYVSSHAYTQLAQREQTGSHMTLYLENKKIGGLQLWAWRPGDID